MKVADLFVSLGVKGADTSKKALTGVKDGLGQVKSMGLETKAMIAAVVYGLERMMSQSAQMGTQLTNTAALTGFSTDALQQWHYAAQQVGVSASEMDGSLKAVQNSMANMLIGKGAPEGLAMVANKVGFDQKRARDTLYVMGQLQKFAQQVPQDIGNQMLKSFGLSEGVIAGMRRNAFRPEVMNNAPKYSGGEVTQLARVAAAWSNLGQKIEMAFGKMTAKDGMQIVNQISKMATEVIKLVGALEKLAQAVHFLEGMGKAFSGWAMLINGATNGVGAITGAVSDPKKRAALGSSVMDFMKELPGVVDAMLTDAMAPAVKPAAGGNKNQNVTIQQNLNFQHDGKDHKKTADSVHSAVKHAYRQMPAQAQVGGT